MHLGQACRQKVTRDRRMHVASMCLAAGVGTSELLTFVAAGFAGVNFPKPLLAFAAIATVRPLATWLCRSIARLARCCAPSTFLAAMSRRCAGDYVPSERCVPAVSPITIYNIEAMILHADDVCTPRSQQHSGCHKHLDTCNVSHDPIRMHYCAA